MCFRNGFADLMLPPRNISFAVWDSKIIQEQKISLNDCLKFMNTLSSQQIKAIQNIDVISWMNESRSYLGDVYNFSGHELGKEYAEKYKTLIEKQLVYAGLRLAAVLERIQQLSSIWCRHLPSIS